MSWLKKNEWNNLWRIVAAVALVLSFAASTMEAVDIWGGEEPVEEREVGDPSGLDPEARSYGQCAVYTEQGCIKYVVADGGEIEVQSGGTLDLQPGATANLNAGVATTGTLTANALVITGTSSLGGNISSPTGAVTVTDSFVVTGTADIDGAFNADGAATFNSAVDIDGAISSGTGAVTVTDALVVTSTLQYGTDSLYPLGYAVVNYQIVCGTSGIFTETTAISVSGLTTITHANVTQITDPVSTGALVTVDAPTTSTLTINSWESDTTVGTTGVNVYYCAIGNQ